MAQLICNQTPHGYMLDWGKDTGYGMEIIRGQNGIVTWIRHIGRHILWSYETVYKVVGMEIGE